MAGLDTVEILVRDPAGIAAIVERAGGAGIGVEKDDQGTTLRDPWGIAITLAN